MILIKMKNKLRNRIGMQLGVFTSSGLSDLETINHIEKISECFAIDFSEWLFINFPNQYKVYQYGEKDGFYTIQELMEQYKNER